MTCQATKIELMSEGTPSISLSNQFLIAMPGMVDGNFAGTVVYLCEHNEKGALGLVINRPLDIDLQHLFEKVDLSLVREDMAALPVFLGGPVQTERGFVLHDSLDDEGGHYSSSMQIDGGLEMTTSRDVLEAISHGAGPKRIFMTLGYSGWGAGQLEDELSRNGWLNVAADHAIIFDTPVELRYDKALALLGIDRSFLQSDAGHA